MNVIGSKYNFITTRWRVLSAAEAGMGLAFEGLAMIRVGDPYKGVGTLTKIFTVKVGDTVLGHNVMDVGTGRDDAGAEF